MPYQLHCDTAAQTELTLEETDDLLDELTTEDDSCNEEDDERDEVAIEDGVTEDGALDERTLDATDDTAPQIAPVTTGVSTAPLVFTCKPNETV